MQKNWSSRFALSKQPITVSTFLLIQIALIVVAILATSITSLDFRTALMVIGGLVVVFALPSIGAQRPPVNAMSCAVGQAEKTVKSTQWDWHSTILGISIGIVPLSAGIILSII